MFSWLKKLRREQPVPSIGRYYTTRNIWVTDAEHYDCIVVHNHRVLAEEHTPIDKVLHSGITPTDNTAEIYDDPEDHIYEEIDDVIPKSEFETYIDSIISLTDSIEKDFGDKSYGKVNPRYPQLVTLNNSSVTNNIKTTDVDTEVNTFNEDSSGDTFEIIDDDVANADESESRETIYSPRTIRCREKCQQWLSDQAALRSNSSCLHIPLSPVLSKCNESREVHPKRHHRVNVRKMSRENRELLLKSIQETWFDSSDESSDRSVVSMSSEDSSSCVTCSTCHDSSNVRKPSRSLTSSSDETSGFYEDTADFNSTANKTSSQSGLSRNSVFSNSDSVVSKNSSHKRISIYLNPKIGFGLNRWYRRKRQ